VRVGSLFGSKKLFFLHLQFFKKMIKKLRILLFFTCFGQVLAAQSPTDRSQIEAVIQSYFDGWFTGDTTKVGYAMHASCRLKLYRDSFIEVTRTDYLSRFKPSTRPAQSDARILSIQITDNIASAKCEIETARFLFTDYFNLLRIGDRWYIVDKVSTRLDKTTLPPDPEKASLDSIERTSRALAQAQLDAYNTRDIEGFLRPYGDSVKVHGFPNKLYYRGIGQMRSEYQQMFDQTPNLHCDLLGRIVRGNYVIDHEQVTTAKDRPPFRAVAIYRVLNGKIVEVWFL
jgi:hypothetical protein